MSYCSVWNAACGDLSRPRRRSLASSSTSRLLSLAEARDRAQSASETVFDVGGGPSALPAGYHTVVELPRRSVVAHYCLWWHQCVCLSQSFYTTVRENKLKDCLSQIDVTWCLTL